MSKGKLLQIVAALYINKNCLPTECKQKGFLFSNQRFQDGFSLFDGCNLPAGIQHSFSLGYARSCLQLKKSYSLFGTFLQNYFSTCRNFCQHPTFEKVFFGPTNVGYLFPQILWSIFQSILHINYFYKLLKITVFFFRCLLLHFLRIEIKNYFKCKFTLGLLYNHAGNQDVLGKSGYDIQCGKWLYGSPKVQKSQFICSFYHHRNKSRVGFESWSKRDEFLLEFGKLLTQTTWPPQTDNFCKCS